MKSFNFARWAIRERSIIYFLIMVILISGALSFFHLGRRSDPDFTIREMVVTAVWPGATAEEMTRQVTDPIEAKLQMTPGLNYIRSYTHGSVSIIYVSLNETLPVEQVRPTWTEVRNLVGEVWSTLPPGVVGPIFNDRFDDVYGSIYALTGEGFSAEEKRKYAEILQRRIRQLPDVQKVILLGVQQEQLYIEMDEMKLAQLGLDPRMVFQALKQQGMRMPAGTIHTEQRDVPLRVEGLLGDAESIRNLTLHLGERTVRLGDIANVRQAYQEPAQEKMYFNGKPAIGVAVSMRSGGNVMALGEELSRTVDAMKADLPLGLDIGQVTNQPQVVEDAIGDFTQSLMEAIVIVLLVSFISLGWRSGIVVALSIPVVVASTFILMKYFQIDLQVVSLGALIISLGLLVDDAIIVIEMMQRKLEEGYSRIDAASAAYEKTAFPMLSGTLITAAGFIPVGLANGIVAEYTHSLFAVTAITLLLSWVVSILVSPVIGYRLIQVHPINEKPSRFKTWQKELLQRFRNYLQWGLDHYRLVVLLTIGIFLIAALSTPLLKKEFFPASIRPELIVEVELPYGASIQATEAEVHRLENHFYGDNRVDSITSYIGSSAPRFILPFEPVPQKNNYAQLIIKATDVASRKSLHRDLENLIANEFPDIRTNIRLIQTGPPAAYPVMLRLTGPDEKMLVAKAREALEIISRDSHIRHANLDWPQETPSIQVDINQDQVRRMGIDSYAVASDLYTKLSGYEVAKAYQGDRLIPVTFRLPDKGSARLGNLLTLPIHIGDGRYVPLGQFATVSYQNENTTIWRQNLQPSITIRANTDGSVPADSVTEQLYQTSLADFRKSLPSGYELTYEGSTKRSHDSMRAIAEVVPFMALVILTVLIFQLRKIKLMLMAAGTAPLGLIGSIIGLQLTRSPIGFIAILGMIALSGMIIRNSIILLDQIEAHRQEGETVREAIVNATILRFRPIMLTALAAILGMIPLMSSHFWGPMAFAFSGGLLIATVLTLFFLPALYAWVYREDVRA